MKAEGKGILVYTGYLFETLLERSQDEPEILRLLAASDFLIDGPFLLKQKDLTLKFRGSRNQRILDVPASLAAGRAVEITF